MLGPHLGDLPSQVWVASHSPSCAGDLKEATLATRHPPAFLAELKLSCRHPPHFTS